MGAVAPAGRSQCLQFDPHEIPSPSPTTEFYVRRHLTIKSTNDSILKKNDKPDHTVTPTDQRSLSGRSDGPFLVILDGQKKKKKLNPWGKTALEYCA